MSRISCRVFFARMMWINSSELRDVFLEAYINEIIFEQYLKVVEDTFF